AAIVLPSVQRQQSLTGNLLPILCNQCLPTPLFFVAIFQPLPFLHCCYCFSLSNRIDDTSINCQLDPASPAILLLLEQEGTPPLPFSSSIQLISNDDKLFSLIRSIYLIKSLATEDDPLLTPHPPTAIAHSPLVTASVFQQLAFVVHPLTSTPTTSPLPVVALYCPTIASYLFFRRIKALPCHFRCSCDCVSVRDVISTIIAHVVPRHVITSNECLLGRKWKWPMIVVLWLLYDNYKKCILAFGFRQKSPSLFLGGLPLP
ncbi:hypothetical protein GW17_00035559, partial [Ensete ventricosum]